MSDRVIEIWEQSYSQTGRDQAERSILTRNLGWIGFDNYQIEIKYQTKKLKKLLDNQSVTNLLLDIEEDHYQFKIIEN